MGNDLEMGTWLHRHVDLIEKMGWIPSAKQTWQQTSPGNSVYQKMEISLGDFPVPSWVPRGLKAAIFQGREALKEVLEQWRLRGSWSGESVFQRCFLDSVGWQKSLVYLTKKAGRACGSENPLPTWNQLFVWTFEPSSFFFFLNSLHVLVKFLPRSAHPPAGKPLDLQMSFRIHDPKMEFLAQLLLYPEALK